MCDSLAEKIVDDWLFDHHLEHRVHVPYYRRNMTADFAVGNTLIEFFGLLGNLEHYDNIVEEKRTMWKERNLEVIELHSNHLFPKNTLDEVLSSLLISQQV